MNTLISPTLFWRAVSAKSLSDHRWLIKISHRLHPLDYYASLIASSPCHSSKNPSYQQHAKHYLTLYSHHANSPSYSRQSMITTKTSQYTHAPLSRLITNPPSTFSFPGMNSTTTSPAFQQTDPPSQKKKKKDWRRGRGSTLPYGH